MGYSIPFSEELAQVERAVQYYQDFANELQSSPESSEELRQYYRGMLTPVNTSALRFRAFFFAMRVQPVLAHIQQSQRSLQVLDLGCGYGLESTLLSLAGAHVQAIDPAANKILEAQRQLAKYENRSQQTLSLRFEAANLFQYRAATLFDAVYSSATLHHIEPAGAAIQAIADLLKPGGWFFLSDENGCSPIQQLVVQKRIGWTSSRLVTHTDPETGQSYPYGNENIRAPFQWARHMRRAGLEPRFIKYCRLLPPVNWPLERLVRGERSLRNIPLVAQIAAIGFLLAAQKSSADD